MRIELRSVLRGHTGRINAITVTPEYFVTGSDDNSLVVWRYDGHQASSGIHAQRLLGHTSPVSGVSHDPTCQSIISSDREGHLRLWADVLCVRRSLVASTHELGVNSVKWSPDGEFIASCGTEKAVKLWSSDLHPIGVLRGFGCSVDEIQITKDGLIYGVGGDQLFTWGKEGALVQVKETNCEDGYMHLALSPNSTIVAVAAGKRVDFYDARTRNNRGTYSTNDLISSVAFLNDSILLVGTERRVITIEVASARASFVLDGHQGAVTALGVGTDYFVSADVRGLVYIWSVADRVPERKPVERRVSQDRSVPYSAAAGARKASDGHNKRMDDMSVPPTAECSFTECSRPVSEPREQEPEILEAHITPHGAKLHEIMNTTQTLQAKISELIQAMPVLADAQAENERRMAELETRLAELESQRAFRPGGEPSIINVSLCEASGLADQLILPDS